MKTLANKAVGSVAPQQKWCRGAFLGPIAMPQHELDPFAPIEQVDQLDVALNGNPQLSQLVGHDSLGLGLVEENDKMIAAGQPIEVQPQKLPLAMIEVRPVSLVAGLEDRLNAAPLLEELRRARLDRDGARVGLRLGQLFDQPAGDAEPGQVHRRGETRGPSADHHDRQGIASITSGVRHGRAPILIASTGWSSIPNDG